jgi:tetratricopeptide (TPR) repeat protein
MAEADCRAAISIDAVDLKAHLLLGSILLAQSHSAEAVATFEEAARLAPEDVTALTSLAIALAESGQIEDAAAADRAALEVSPGNAAAHQHLAGLKTFARDDQDLAALEGAASQDPGPPLLFALAKAYDDVGDSERAFAALREANACKRASFHYDLAADIAFLDGISSTFDQTLFERFPEIGSPSDVPVLIVGMPRSGTTLVEHILASHPAVHGAGELAYLMQAAGAVSLLSPSAEPFPHGVKTMSADDLDRLGTSYVDRLRGLAPNATKVSDKEPFNFRYLGLVRLLTPNARIIHCRRDPMDTCLSCFKTNFQTVEFSFDLEELGHYYRAYERLMDHWRRVLPEDWILEVDYETLTDNFDDEVRRIVSHCGLPWNEACLNFHRANRPVRTASFAQVRRPLYRDSIGRWRRYEHQLEALRTLLDTGRLTGQKSVPPGRV